MKLYHIPYSLLRINYQTSIYTIMETQDTVTDTSEEKRIIMTSEDDNMLYCLEIKQILDHLLHSDQNPPIDNTQLTNTIELREDNKPQEAGY